MASVLDTGEDSDDNQVLRLWYEDDDIAWEAADLENFVPIFDLIFCMLISLTLIFTRFRLKSKVVCTH